MTESAFFTQKVAYFGAIPPQSNDDAMQGNNAKKQRQEAHFFNMGFDGNEANRNHLKQKTSGKDDEPKQVPLPSENGKGTFWTVCPYCYYMFEYGNKYEECCLLCQNCSKGFHGLAVAPPPESALGKRKDGEYYSGYGFFPLGYFGKSSLFDKKEAGGGDDDAERNHPDVVEISDDSDGDKEEGNAKDEVKVEEVVNNGEGKGRSRGMRKKRVKSVPRNSKKIMGRGVKLPDLNVELGKGIGDGDRGSGSGLEEDEFDFEFFEGDDDIYVGLKDI